MGDGGGDVVLVPADAFVVDRVFEAVLISIELVPSSPLPLKQFAVVRKTHDDGIEMHAPRIITRRASLGRACGNGSMAAADDWSFAKHICLRGEAVRQLAALWA